MRRLLFIQSLFTLVSVAAVSIGVLFVGASDTAIAFLTGAVIGAAVGNAAATLVSLLLTRPESSQIVVRPVPRSDSVRLIVK